MKYCCVNLSQKIFSFYGSKILRVLKNMKVKRSNEALTEEVVKDQDVKDAHEVLDTGIVPRQVKKPNHFVRSYRYSYSSNSLDGKGAEEMEERVIIDNGKGRIKTRKNEKVEERDLTEQEIKEYDEERYDPFDFASKCDLNWSNLLSWDPWFGLSSFPYDRRRLTDNRTRPDPQRLLCDQSELKDSSVCEHCEHCQQPIKSKKVLSKKL